VSAPSEEPTWKQRAVERSTRAAKLRAEQRVQRFLNAAQAIMMEKGNTDFTVKEVVERSRQSLRSGPPAPHRTVVPAACGPFILQSKLLLP
jgi:hypothetical protein